MLTNGALVTPNTDVDNSEFLISLKNDVGAGSCKTKSKKQLKEVEDAQLAAHR